MSLRRLRVSSGSRTIDEAAPGRRPRILTDVSVIIRHDAQTGIQRVVRAVLDNLLQRSGTAFDVVPVFASRTHGYRYADPEFLSKPVGELQRGGPVRAGAGDRFLGLDLTAHLLPSYRRQLQSWRRAGATVHLVVYDLLPLQRPDWFTDKTVKRFNRWLDVVRYHCDQALCISDQVADDLRAHLPADAALPAISRLKLAGDIASSRPSSGIDAETSRAINFAKRGPAVLMVGTIEPRKAYDKAIAAFEYLWQRLGEQAPGLVIAGKPGWRTEALQQRLRNHPQSGQRLFWLPAVSDEGLAELYESTRGLLLTSYAEGFGLPAIEAAMHGKRALVRDLAVFREQQLPNLRFFADDSPCALAETIMDLAEDSDDFRAPHTLPNWDDCVTEMLRQMGLHEAETAAASTFRNYAAA